MADNHLSAAEVGEASTSGLIQIDYSETGTGPEFGDSYGEYFDAEQFVEDGNDIRFQLPSRNPDVSLKPLDADYQRATIRRRKTTVLRRRPTRAPTVDRSTKPSVALLSPQDVMDSGDSLMTAEQQFAELQCVRSLTMSMGQKREYRDTIQSCSCSQPGGLTLARHRAMKRLMKMRNKWDNISTYTEIWRGTLKEIEGQFGAGIMEYFRLVKWMIFLNLLLAIIICFIIVPQLILSPNKYDEKFSNQMKTLSQSDIQQDHMFDEMGRGRGPLKHDFALALNCTLEYRRIMMQRETTWYQGVLDFFQGTGMFEDTILFYGYYFNKTMDILPDGSGGTYPWYNMSIAYLVVTMIFFITSLLFIVSSTSTGLKTNLLADSIVLYKAINKVFAGWDYGLYKEKAAKVKHSLIRHEIMSDMAEERRRKLYKSRTPGEQCNIYCRRIIVNMIVIAVLTGCGIAIYFTQQRARVELDKSPSIGPFLALVWQYLPSVLITVMYAIFPPIFKQLTKLEKYYPATELNINIARIVLLRLATVFLLLTPIYVQIIGCDTKYCGNCDTIYCWETFIGQQVYKLVLLDFLVIVGVVFFVEFPRRLLWERFKDKWLFRTIGQEEFDIPVNVMDVVYTQTLCWIGAFYSPLIPIITLFKVLAFFYLRKLSLFKNQRPSDTPYRASSTHLFFMFVLTISFFLGILAVGISVGVIEPSRSCGPFRVRSSVSQKWTMFDVVVEAMLLTPDWFSDMITFLASTAFQVTLIITLGLLLYFYSALSTAQTRMVQLLRGTLSLEEKDKHWLLNKVNRNLMKELGAVPKRK